MRKRILSIFMILAIAITATIIYCPFESKAAVQTLTTASQLKNAFSNGGTYVIGSDISISSQLVVPKGKSVTLYCSNKAHTITSTYSGIAIVVNGGGSFKLGNTVSDSYKLTLKRTSQSYTVVYVKENGTFRAYSGIISTAKYGIYNNGDCMLNNGTTISNCKRAGVFNSRTGIYYMYGGTIQNITPSKNLDTMGRGVETRGLAKIFGGKITRCGRGISNNGKTIVYNCTITSNDLQGIFNSGEIQIQNATIYGSEIGIANVNLLIMNGGTVSNNDYGITSGAKDYTEYEDEYWENYFADNSTSGVEVLGELFGDLANAPGYCGFTPIQLYDDSMAVTRINGGSIYSNNIGMYHTNGSLYMTNGTVTSNKTYGIYVDYNTLAYLSGCSVTKNGINSTGPYPCGVLNYGYLYISSNSDTNKNTTIANNTGYGIYCAGDLLDIMNSSINNNTKSGVYVQMAKTYITGGAYYNNGGYGIYSKKSSNIKKFSGYNMFGNTSGSVNFSY